MKNKQVVLNEYLITKQITKALADYGDNKNQPHVQIAIREKRKGKSEADIVGNFISYVICKPTEDQKGNNIAERAYHPDEIKEAKGKLVIDTEWYITNQILPPITRLIEHIDGIEVDYVASCLGIEPGKYKYYKEKHNDGEEEERADLFSAKMKDNTNLSRARNTLGVLKIKCFYCQKEQHFSGVYKINPKNNKPNPQ